MHYCLLTHAHLHRRHHVCPHAHYGAEDSGDQEDRGAAPLPHVGQGSGDGDGARRGHRGPPVVDGSARGHANESSPPRAAPAECWDGSAAAAQSPVASETAAVGADVSRRGWPWPPPAGGGTPHRRRGRGSVRPAGEEELSPPHAVDGVSYGERESVAPGARALTWRCR
jgi:hypothetical protein